MVNIESKVNYKYLNKAILINMWGAIFSVALAVSVALYDFYIGRTSEGRVWLIVAMWALNYLILYRKHNKN